MTTSATKVRYLDTTTAYDLWSEVYDTDGNFLQALDTVEMQDLLPRLISMLTTPKPWNIVDLGCGTGRNTLALLDFEDINITALDLSPKMLEIARGRLTTRCVEMRRAQIPTFEVFDMMTSKSIPESARNADAVVSTLVIEHVPLDVFFRTVVTMLKKGGLLLLTNMHSDMGKISQAGFVDPKTGEKIRPTSYAHEVNAVVEEAAKVGLEIVGHVEERSVDEEIAPKLGQRANKWIGIDVWFGITFRKISS